MAESLGVFAAEAKKWPADAAHKWKVFCAVGELRLPSLHCSAVARGKPHWVAESSLEVHMRIIRHSHTSARITEFVKEDRARVNIKVTPSLQYTHGIELRASIDDTTAAIVYLRLDDLRMITAPRHGAPEGVAGTTTGSTEPCSRHRITKTPD